MHIPFSLVDDISVFIFLFLKPFVLKGPVPLIETCSIYSDAGIH